MFNRFQALAIFNDYAAYTHMTTTDMAGILRHWGSNFEGLGKWTINQILENQESIREALPGSEGHDLVLKAEDLSWKPTITL